MGNNMSNSNSPAIHQKVNSKSTKKPTKKTTKNTPDSPAKNHNLKTVKKGLDGNMWIVEYGKEKIIKKIVRKKEENMLLQ